MNPRFREAGPGDTAYIRRVTQDQLGPVVREAWGSYASIDELMQRMAASGVVMVAEVDGRPAGYIYYALNGPYLHIGAMAVEANVQGRGLGSACIAHAEQQAQRLGLEGLELWVQNCNPRARKLYERLGFTVVGTPWLASVEMRREIQFSADPLDPDRLLHAAVTAARLAGGAIRGHFQQRRVIEAKSARDVLAEADLAAEAAIISHLRSLYPDFGIRSEEAGAIAGNQYTWSVDPLDGTNNFVLGIPYFSTSIALLVDGGVKLGVVYQPLLDECFAAIAGKGAWCNGRPLRIGDLPPLAGATLSWVQGHQVGSHNRQANRLRHGLEGGVKRLLNTWAPAWDWCLLARGDLAALISYDSEPEDQYAGALIAAEAGALVTDFKGKPWKPGTRFVLAAGNASVYQEVGDLLQIK